jgi:hypothetical protein
MMSAFRQLFILPMLLIFISACAGKSPVEPEKSVFQHDFTDTKVPWTDKQFDNVDVSGLSRQLIFAR